MENLVLVVHILTALAIIALILLQQGKGAVAGASFGSGASQTVFGSQGSGGFFAKATAVCAVIFFSTSFGLAIIAKNQAGLGDTSIPTVIESRQEAADSEVPQVDDEDEIDPVEELPEAPDS